MLAIALIAAVIYLFTATRRTRKVALDKGVEQDDLLFFTVFLWLYAVPPVVTVLFVKNYNPLLALLLAGLYVPGIVVSRKLALKLATGYDYERKAGKDYDKAMWLGYAGIGLVILGLVLSIPGTLQAAHP